MDLLRAEEKRIRDLFNDHYQFEIPPYQRPYVWGETQITQLCEDLDEALQDYLSLDAAEQEHHYYFLGSIVLVKEERREKAVVVDGQQRLITLVILLNVLRHLFIHDADKKVVTKYLYREGSPMENTRSSYRLIPHMDCKDFFQQYIQDETGLAKVLYHEKGRFKEIKCDEKEEIFIHNARHLFKILQEWEEQKRQDLFRFREALHFYPLRRPKIKEAMDKIKKAKNRILAMPTALPAMPPKPKTAAIMAIMKKITA